MNTQRIVTISLLALLLLPMLAIAQSIERGYVKEYHGEQAKTPLAGVELNIVGAPTTVSDDQGHYELKFAVLKPGEAVKCNEIYKSGYVIFNKDALDYWRISNNKKPFVIVMCKEIEFRILKKRFYGIIEKSYRDEYQRQLALVNKMKLSLKDADEREKQLKKEYEEKLSNINTYVELFARIDRSEMDSVVGKALQLIEEGNIEEGIKVYEQLQLSQQVQKMMDKLQAGETMLKAAQNIIDDTKNDLQTLTEKLKQQIGLYEMGGKAYEQKRRDTMATLIGVFIKLNQVTNGMYNEELGEWSCRYVKETTAWHSWTPWLRKAAKLPSYHGLMDLADRYSMLAYFDAHLVDSVRYCYEKVLTMEAPEDVKRKARLNLDNTAEFFFTIPQGDTLFAKKDTVNGGVMVTKKTIYCFNRVSGNLVLPTSIVHEGRKRDITGIDCLAFCNNRHLKSVRLPDKLLSLSSQAFYNCDSLHSAWLNEKLIPTKQGYAIFPDFTYLHLPKKFDNPEWVVDFVKKRYINILSSRYIVDSVKDSAEYQSMRQFLLDLQKVRGIKKEDKEKYLSIVHLMDSARIVVKEKELQQITLDSVAIWSQICQLPDTVKLSDHRKLYKKLLEYYQNIVQEVVSHEYLKQPDAAVCENLLELKSIASIAIEAVTKNKMVSQLKKIYSNNYISAAVKWAIRNELRHRHEWHLELQRYNELVLRFGKDWSEQIHNFRQIYGVVTNETFVKNSIKNSGKASETVINLQKQASIIWMDYDNAIKLFDTQQQKILTDLLTGTKSIDEIIVNYGINYDDCRQLIYLLENKVNEMSMKKTEKRLTETLAY